MGSVEVSEDTFDWIRLFLETRFCTNASCAQIARQKLGSGGSQRPLRSLKCCFQQCDVHANDPSTLYFAREKEGERKTWRETWAHCLGSYTLPVSVMSLFKDKAADKHQNNARSLWRPRCHLSNAI